MDQVIEVHIMPLVGRVRVNGFNPDSIKSISTLQRQIINHTEKRNIQKIKMYLAFCIQMWKNLNDCPIQSDILSNAINTIG